MEPKKEEGRPDSPKKKMKPSSTTNSGDSTDNCSSEMVNGLVCPTRGGRHDYSDAEASSSSDNTSSRILTSNSHMFNRNQGTEAGTIQEEVVSSSENMVPKSGNQRKKTTSPSEGDADSLTLDNAVSIGSATSDFTASGTGFLRVEHNDAVASLDSEAEMKLL